MGIGEERSTHQPTEDKYHLVRVERAALNMAESIGKDRAHDRAHAVRPIPDADTERLLGAAVPVKCKSRALGRVYDEQAYQIDVKTANKGRQAASKSPRRKRVAARAG